MTLGRLLAPVAPDRFFERMWSRRSVHLRAESDRFSELLPAGGWLALLEHAVIVDAATRDATGRQQQRRIEPAVAKDAFAQGQTICADVSRAPAVAELLGAMHGALRSYRGTPFAKLYVSPPGAGFAPHMDGDHVFVVQLSGKKRWWYSGEPALPNAPLGGKVVDGHAVHTFPRDGVPIVDEEGEPLPAFDRTTAKSVTLEQGDVLYLPPGTWHTTDAETESIAISLSPARTPLFVLALDALRERLQDRRTLWPDVVAPERASGISRRVEQTTSGAADALRAAVATLADDDLRLHWARETFARAESPSAPVPELGPDDRLEHADGGFALLPAPADDGEPAVFLFRPGVELELPVQARTFIERLAATPSFTVRDAAAFDPSWSRDDVVGVLNGLVEAGVLVHSSATSRHA